MYANVSRINIMCTQCKTFQSIDDTIARFAHVTAEFDIEYKGKKQT